MRRVLVFAAFLLLLGLTTATAASFSVQAEDITSFSTTVSIEPPPPPPPPAPAGRTFFLTNGPRHGDLVTIEPNQQEGNKSATLGFGPLDVKTTFSDVNEGNRIHYTAWRSAPVASGFTFSSRTVTVQFARTANTGGEIVAALFSCDPNAYLPTVDGNGCRYLASAQGGGETISIQISATLDPGDELRLKMVSGTAANSAIQWGWKPQNRDGKLVIL